MASKKHIPAAKGTVEIVLLDGGGFITGDDTKIHANGSSEPFYMYDWCFYIYHKATGQRILWDLGISDDRNLYTPFILNYHWPSCNPVGPRRRLVDQLADLDVAAETIDAVIFSHAHWDHCRPPKHEFPNAKIVFGPGTASHCSPGHMLDGDIRPMVQWDSRFFGDKSVQTEFFDELEGRWTAWCSFDRAMDYFGDGSLWIMDAPGHMPFSGCLHNLQSYKLILLARLVDAMADKPINCTRDIFIGRRQIANVDMPDGSKFCLHENLDDSLATIGALREAVDDYGMHIAMAHDAEFIKQGTDDVLMSILHPLFDESCLRRIRAHQRP